MARTKISEFSVTAADNTEIDGIDIAEGCAPSGINNSIRELMSQLKDFQTGAAGDPFNGAVNGTVGATTPATGAFTTVAAQANNIAILAKSGTANYCEIAVQSGTTDAIKGQFQAVEGTTNKVILGARSNHPVAVNTNDVERIRIDTSGNVGVGTTSPAQRLSVSSGTNNDGILITNTSTANTTAKTARVGFVGTDISGTIKEAANIYVVPDDVNYVGARMSFYTRGSDTVAEHMTIASSGNVGIGTVVPVAKLDVIGSGSNGTIRAAHPGNTSFGVVILAETTAGTDDPAIVIKNYNGGSPVTYGIVCKDNGSLAFNSGITPTGGFGTERVRIDSSGNVGIGTASPTKKLDVVGAGAFTTSVDGTTLTVSGGGVGEQSGQILQTNTYAGVPTPNKYLRVDGSGQWQILNSAYSATCMSLTDAGAASQGNNSSTWTVVSDVRIKQNIRPITNALGKICSLNPCHFEYKTRPDKTKTNFIAQEFEQVFPGHVVESAPAMEFEALFAEGEKMKSIDADLIPYLVGAIKQLKSEFDAYKASHP
jgi:hypothetical protein